MKTQSKDQSAGQYTSVSVERHMYYDPGLAPILNGSSSLASNSQAAPLKGMDIATDKQLSSSRSTQVNKGKDLENRKEAIALKDEPKKRTPVMVTPDSSSSDLSCVSSVELIENVEFPYTDNSPELLLEEPPTETLKGRNKGFRPFMRANSLSSSAGSVATVTVNTILRKRTKGPLYSLTVSLKRTYETIDPNYGYTGRANPRRVLTRPSKPATNFGYDNENKDYIIRVGDIIGSGKNNYRIIDLLGSGTFGQVVKCEDVSSHKLVAVKIVKNKSRFRSHSAFEADIVQQLHRKIKPQDHHYLLNTYETFDHANHLCIVSELLSYSLLDLLKQNGHRGLPIHLVRSFSIRLIETLVLLKEAKFIHCDLKPENILLQSVDSTDIKVVDYGAACHESIKPHGYNMQTRFYRAPEVILGAPYGYPIDMWSTGCVIGELFFGMPLFPGTSDHNQLRRIIDMMGIPPQEMLAKGTRTGLFFNCKSVSNRPTIHRMKSQDQYNEEQNKISVPQRQYFPQMGLTDLILNYPYPAAAEDDKEQEISQRKSLADFLKGLLIWDPETRWTPKQARGHPFLTGELSSSPYIPMKDTDCSDNSPTINDAAKVEEDGQLAKRTTELATQNPKPNPQPEIPAVDVAPIAVDPSAALSAKKPLSTPMSVAPVSPTAPGITEAKTARAKTTKSGPSSIERVLGSLKGKAPVNPSISKPLPSPKPVSIMVNRKTQKSSLIGDKRNVIIMPAATTEAPQSASSKSVVGSTSPLAVRNHVLENLRMHYQQGGSLSDVLVTSSPTALAAKRSDPDLSKKVKIAHMIKLRRGSHDSFRTPDEIRLKYVAAAPNELYQHNNSSRAKLNSFSSVGSHDSSDTSGDISSNQKPSSKHAGEAAGGLLMMRGKKSG